MQDPSAEAVAGPAPLSRRLIGAVIGHPATRRLALTHAVDDVADSLITLSLLGSLFFNVSLDASRTQILLYLLLAAAPLALVAPAVGPLLDRTRFGYRWVIAGTQLSRALLALGLGASLRTLVFYPLVFGILLARKAYALARATMAAQLVPNEIELVRASGLLARIGTVAGGAGTALGGSVILVVGVEWLPVLAAGVYLVAAGISSTLPPTPAEAATATAIVRAETPADVHVATSAVALIRAATGALTFLLALAIKRGGGDEWIYASALVAAGIGAFVGTMVAPRLHRRLSSERIIALTLLAPAAVSALGVLIVGNVSIIAIALSIGMAGSVAARAMDALYGRIAQRVRGRAISRSELLFQLSNVTGAVCAVVVTPSPRPGFGVVALVLLAGGLAYAFALPALPPPRGREPPARPAPAAEQRRSGAVVARSGGSLRARGQPRDGDCGCGRSGAHRRRRRGRTHRESGLGCAAPEDRRSRAPSRPGVGGSGRGGRRNRPCARGQRRKGRGRRRIRVR